MTEQKENTFSSQFVPYDIALKMKELGFDEPCLAFFSAIDQELIFMRESGDTINNSYAERTVTAPLYQQAFDWLRNKYQIHGQISILTTGKWHYNLRKESNNWDIEFPSKERYGTYEEARLACLNYLLNQIQ